MWLLPRWHDGRLARAAILALAIAGGLTAASPIARATGARDASPRRFKAVAFDYLALFNPDSVAGAAEQAFPGHGRELTNLWRTRQFEYCWLRSMTGHYVDFSRITDDALVYAAGALRLELAPDKKRDLLQAYLRLAPWQDTVDVLQRLRASGIRVIALANFSQAMLRENAERAGIAGLFDALVSTDENRTYKPDPRAYRLGMERLHLGKDEVLFVASAGWDAAGAKSFGYPTYWVNRSSQPLEGLGLTPDGMSSGLEGLMDFLRRQ
jgi:2-haloacid dehalogenase